MSKGISNRITVGGIGTRGSNVNWTQSERILWKNMIHRVQSNKSYNDCSICNRWLILSQFVEDIRKMDFYNNWKVDSKNWVLDKDSKYQGNKIYSPQACVFIPLNENQKYENKPKCYEYNQEVYQSREYEAEHTDGTKLRFNNQKQFAREYGLDFRNVSRSIQKGGRTKGWKIIEITD